MARKKTLTAAQRVANQDRYNRAYHKTYYKTYSVSFDKRTTGDVAEWFDAQENKTQAVIALVRKELGKNNN